MKDKKDIQSTIDFIKSLVSSPKEFAKLTKSERRELLTVAGQLSRPSKLEFKTRGKAISKERRNSKRDDDRKLRADTGIRSARTDEVFSAPLKSLPPQESQSKGELHSARNCYVCKKLFKKIHHFYDSMCMECADFNYEKRFQTSDLTGQIALITGSRLKIGYQATLMMLRAGATVIATTRFPVDSANRYAKESDYETWKNRLKIYGLDLRHTPSVEIFSRYIVSQYPRLDILLNNAAQTVRRPPGFYSHLMEVENQAFIDLSSQTKALLDNSEALKNKIRNSNSLQSSNNAAIPVTWQQSVHGMGILSSAQLSQIRYSFSDSQRCDELFPVGKLDADLQQVDLRTTNSWRLTMGEVAAPEMLEVQLVNAVAPFILCNHLMPLMRKHQTGKKHIVNVSAMEGKFHRFKKEDRHPHTNMAKAALNMMTHTSAGSLANEGIYMNAVDTGWVTDEDPAQLAAHKEITHDFQPPLDIVDGAARICDPFFDGINTGKHWSGKFLKDYFPIDW